MKNIKWLVVISALNGGVFSSAVAADDYAAWSVANSDGTWTGFAETSIDKTSLSTVVPTDVGNFCPGYGGANKNPESVFPQVHTFPSSLAAYILSKPAHYLTS
jgi:hypothetical protein